MSFITRLFGRKITEPATILDAARKRMVDERDYHCENVGRLEKQIAEAQNELAQHQAAYHALNEVLFQMVNPESVKTLDELELELDLDNEDNIPTFPFRGGAGGASTGTGNILVTSRE